MSDYREEKKEDGESLLNENNNTNNEVRNNEYDQVLVADETNKQNANLTNKKKVKIQTNYNQQAKQFLNNMQPSINNRPTSATSSSSHRKKIGPSQPQKAQYLSDEGNNDDVDDEANDDDDGAQQQFLPRPNLQQIQQQKMAAMNVKKSILVNTVPSSMGPRGSNMEGSGSGIGFSGGGSGGGGGGGYPMKQHPNTASIKTNAMNHGSGYEIDKDDKIDIWGTLLVGISYFFLIFTFPFSLCACVKVAQEYERAVIFRLGRILSGGARGPGIFFVLPCIDTYTKVDLRTVTFDVPPQEILTKDSVTVSVDAVVYFRIFNAVISVINVEDAAKSTKLLAASTLRNILGTKSLHEILSDRESVAILIQNNLDDATGPWGVKVERVEVKDVRLPVQLQRAMATEAEAAREARAKVIAAEGEQKASKALKEAAEVISESPIAIQLRYLQTLTQIASEKNSTIVFPIPLEMLSFLANKTAGIFKVKT